MKNIPDQYGRRPTWQDRMRAKRKADLMHHTREQLAMLHRVYFKCEPPKEMTWNDLRLKVLKAVSDLVNGVPPS